jgi:hypothetical protein
MTCCIVGTTIAAATLPQQQQCWHSSSNAGTAAAAATMKQQRPTHTARLSFMQPATWHRFLTPLSKPHTNPSRYKARKEQKNYTRSTSHKRPPVTQVRCSTAAAQLTRTARLSCLHPATLHSLLTPSQTKTHTKSPRCTAPSSSSLPVQPSCPVCIQQRCTACLYQALTMTR